MGGDSCFGRGRILGLGSIFRRHLFWVPFEFTWQSSINSSSVNSLSAVESILHVFRCGLLLLMALSLSCGEVGYTMLDCGLNVDELGPSVGGDVPQGLARPEGEESCLPSLSDFSGVFSI